MLDVIGCKKLIASGWAEILKKKLKCIAMERTGRRRGKAVVLETEDSEWF
jgi:hypothetical protein